MVDSPRPPGPSAWIGRTLVATFAAAIAAAFLLRLTALAEPLGIDQSLWASAVRGMSRGQLLYRDVWEQRPPGIYWIYLAGFRTLGWTPSTVAWLDILASAATTLLIFGIAARLANRLTAALGAALYAVLTMPAWLYSHAGFLERSVCETFIVVCVGLSFLCALRFRQWKSPLLAAGAGLALGAAIVLKPNAAVYLPAVLLWMALQRQPSATEDRGLLMRGIAVTVLCAAVVPAIAVLWLWTLGLIQEARTAVVDFNRFYVSQGFTPGAYLLAFSKAVWLRIKTEPLWLAGSVASLVAVSDLARTRRLPPLAGLAVVWGGAAAIVIVANGARLFNSYFIQALAPLSLAAAWLIGEAGRRSPGRRAIAVAAGVLMVLQLAERQYPQRVFGWARAGFDVLRHQSDPTAYLERFGGYNNARGYSARANTELADYIRAHTSPDEQVYLFGINGAGVYFAADRLSAHRFLRVNFFVPTEFPDPRFELPAVTRELASRRPRYIIFEQLHSRSAMGVAVDSLRQHPAVAELLHGYQLETQIEDFTVYRLVD